MADERRKKKNKFAASTPAWMTTFGDMNSLLLTFFIAMLSNGETKSSDLNLIMSAFTGSIGMLEGGMTLSAGQLADMGQTIESLPSREVGTRLSQAMKEVGELMKPELRSRYVRIQQVNKGYKITLSSDLFFKPGSAEIDFDEGRETLRKIAQMLMGLGNTVRIEVIGNTDNSVIPVGSEMYSKFRSNWELSTARACAVVQYFQDFGVNPANMYAEGRGEYDPIESNNSAEGRAYNRRVDIYISDSSVSMSQPQSMQ